MHFLTHVYLPQIVEEREVFRRDVGESMTTFTFWDAHAQRYGTITNSQTKEAAVDLDPSLAAGVSRSK